MTVKVTNQTSTNRFVLLGITDIPNLQALCVLLLLAMYMATLSGNSLLIIVVRINTRLHTPMYFFLSNLSIIDICFSSTIVPKVVSITLAQDKSVSLMECASQMFFSQVLGGTECMILAVMAYDRYAAVCKPLHYNKIMNRRFCICLAAGSWMLGSINTFMHVALTFQLPFCRSHHINHFFCEMPPIFKLSCRDTWLNVLIMYITTSIIGMYSFCLTVMSYVRIISTILKIRSSEGRRKAFSTCASHLTVVFLYYGALMFMYLRPRSAYSPEMDKSLSMIYTSVTPMLNPIIYSIRNKDIKNTVREKLLKQHLQS